MGLKNECNEKPLCHLDETLTLSAVLERLNPHLAQITMLHRVFCTGVAEVPSGTPNVLRASHLLNTLYKAIIEYDSAGEASEQSVSVSVIGIEQQMLDMVCNCTTSSFLLHLIQNYVHCLLYSYQVALLFSLWVETVRPYLEIVDEWIVHGHLFDPAKEFVIQR